jgi:hypothetical protein
VAAPKASVPYPKKCPFHRSGPVESKLRLASEDPDASEQHHPVSALCYLRSESETVVVFGSYKFCPIRGRAASPATQGPNTTVESGSEQDFEK